jgi:hypothetical protein
MMMQTSHLVQQLALEQPRSMSRCSLQPRQQTQQQLELQLAMVWCTLATPTPTPTPAGRTTRMSMVTLSWKMLMSGLTAPTAAAAVPVLGATAAAAAVPVLVLVSAQAAMALPAAATMGQAVLMAMVPPPGSTLQQAVLHGSVSPASHQLGAPDWHPTRAQWSTQPSRPAFQMNVGKTALATCGAGAAPALQGARV